jgi:hypothetical protein
MEEKQDLPVLLYRNKGWERETLNPSFNFIGDTAVTVDPDISLDYFFIAHRIKIPRSDIDDRDKKLQYPWHGTVEGSSVSSWEKSVIWDKKYLIASMDEVKLILPFCESGCRSRMRPPNSSNTTFDYNSFNL